VDSVVANKTGSGPDQPASASKSAMRNGSSA
jgi:hypothetical protein